MNTERHARHLEPREVADERVERECDHARDEEEKEDVAERPRQEEREDEDDGQDDELNPPRDLDRRAGAGHARDRTAEPWRPLPRTRPCYGQPRMATPRSRHAARLRATGAAQAGARAPRRRPARRSGYSPSVTLALTAFDGDGGSSPAAAGPAPLPVTSAPPEPNILATVGNLRVAVSGRAGRRHRRRLPRQRGRRARAPAGRAHRRTRVFSPGSGAASPGRRRPATAWYQLDGGPLRTLDVGAVAGTDVYSPDRRDRRRDPRPGRLGTDDRLRDRAPPDLRAVARRHDPERPSRSRRSPSERTSQPARRSSAR